MDILILMMFKVNLYKRMSKISLILLETKLNGSGFMPVILTDTIKLLSSSNLPTEKNNSPSKPNISIPLIIP
jgi:hypothetical protein